MSKYMIFADKRPYNNDIEIWIEKDHVPGDSIQIVTDFILETAEEGANRSPSMLLSIRNAQILMDALWGCGLRPSQGSGSAGSLSATQKHLEDMRKIVSKQLDINLG